MTRRKMGFFNLFNVTIFVQGDYFLLLTTKTLVALDKNSCESWLQNPSFLLVIHYPTQTWELELDLLLLHKWVALMN